MIVCILLLSILVLFTWAVLHGGTKDKQPIIDVHPTIYYDDDHDVSGLLEED